MWQMSAAENDRSHVSRLHFFERPRQRRAAGHSDACNASAAGLSQNRCSAARQGIPTATPILDPRSEICAPTHRAVPRRKYDRACRGGILAEPAANAPSVRVQHLMAKEQRGPCHPFLRGQQFRRAQNRCPSHATTGTPKFGDRRHTLEPRTNAEIRASRAESRGSHQSTTRSEAVAVDGTELHRR